ncbi:MAG: MarR family transcriptional regulator [Planctomycetales bacterium]|nr:MarR family transcriptional regulator [Planctomycetales bacterium]
MKNERPQRPRGLAAEIGKQRPFDVVEREAYLNLVRTHAALSSEAETLFKKYGLSQSQYNVLRILRGHGGPTPVSQVAREMVDPQPDVTRLVDRLERQGLVVRRRGTDDRRVVRVELTPTASALLRKIDRPLKKMHERQFEHMSQAHVQQLRALLLEARQNLV